MKDMIIVTYPESKIWDAWSSIQAYYFKFSRLQGDRISGIRIDIHNVSQLFKILIGAQTNTMEQYNRHPKPEATDALTVSALEE